MKTWLKKCGRLICKHRGDLLGVGALLLLAVFCFQLGVLYGSRDAAFWRSIAATPEPERCALCGGGDEARCHAPVLVDLAAGAVGELRVYDPDPQRPGELAGVQQTGTFSLGMCAGIVTRRDTDTQTCRADLPRETAPMDPAHFCLRCRALLAETATEGYILVDLYDLEHIRAYQIAPGRDYIIRDYTLSIARETRSDGPTLTVRGLLFDG